MEVNVAQGCSTSKPLGDTCPRGRLIRHAVQMLPCTHHYTVWVCHIPPAQPPFFVCFFSSLPLPWEWPQTCPPLPVQLHCPGCWGKGRKQQVEEGEGAWRLWLLLLGKIPGPHIHMTCELLAEQSWTSGQLLKMLTYFS